ncbi:MAG: hypothetical protein NZ602_07020 [Thermoguttaceae bacterium]|nr:hypothetical protein [Thermoguttaceae bacterium]MDW8037099.1 hypothetical protein [Thermoguttaceae bacterium]
MGLWWVELAGLGWAAPEELPPMAQWIPEDAVLVLEVTKPGQVLDALLAPAALERIAQSVAWKQFQAAPNYRELIQVVQFLEKSLQTDWIAGVKKLFGGGLTICVHPKDAVLIAVDTEDPEMLQQLHEILRGFATLEAAKHRQSNRIKSIEYRGQTCWSFGPQEAHCLIGRRLFLTNKPDLLKQVLDRRAEPGLARLAKQPWYQAARQAVADGALATLYADMKVLQLLPAVQKALNQPNEPLSALLLTGLTESLKQANWLALGLSVQKDGVLLRAKTDGRLPKDSPGQFSIPSLNQGALPTLEVPRLLASVSLYRDLHGFYAAKDKLFPERTGGLIFFENMMGIFFTGRDLTEEVLGQLGPEVRLVVAAQEYDPAIGTPEIQLPGFAAVFRMKEPDKFFEVVEEAWQKALGLINFTRGQQALPGLIMDKGFHGQVKYTVAYFSAKEEKDRKALDVRFNFRPTLARTGPYAILSSTEQLACDLIDALQKESKQSPTGQVLPMAGVHSALELRASQLAALLRTNREALIRQNMVEKGNSRQQAENEVDMFITLLSLVKNMKLQIATLADGTQATLEAKLQLP